MIILEMEIPISMKEKYYTIKILDTNDIKWNFEQIYKKDISAVDGVKRNPEWARTILWSYARNMATLSKKTVINSDIRASYNITDITISSYIEALEKLFVIKDIDAWTPQIRSKTAIRSAKKHIFIISE